MTKVIAVTLKGTIAAVVCNTGHIYVRQATAQEMQAFGCDPNIGRRVDGHADFQVLDKGWSRYGSLDAPLPPKLIELLMQAVIDVVGGGWSPANVQEFRP